jgi:hypothetical protein
LNILNINAIINVSSLIQFFVFNFIGIIQMTPRKSLRTANEKKQLVRVSFEVSREIRSAFKSKLAIQNKTLRDVFVDFMKEYIKK